ncbi:hypothetical protein PRZ48_014310 [Zasmidium cellare]|uniref:D-xylose 1-dehydrogenase (NADP(+), D-xylono-1,5-lactone-forming) n=1 Tax=Zasmidium cellare TaxID=395010 RepID=A0ABR0E0V8_ZASCE|nr:hypothetical protein PRZ48_014310 [Zasmidium cellare]
MPSDNKSTLPTIRWGIVGTGLISSWFVEDLTVERPDAKAHHIIQAIGSSSTEKGQAFVRKHIPNTSPTVHGTYEGLFNDSDVDVLYIGTPHAFHKDNALAAIASGKHVLVEKPFTINAKEARIVLEAAKAKGVFVMEAMWTRFTPLVKSLWQKIFEEKVIGDVRRTFCDFGLDMDFPSLPPDSRLKSRELGAGSLLDIGVYSLTWGLLTLEGPTDHESPMVVALQSLVDEVDVTTSVLLQYPSTGRQGILTSMLESRTDAVFARIEGTTGFVTIEGPAASAPTSFTIYPKVSDPISGYGAKGETFSFEQPGKGFFYEADAVAVDVAKGKLENDVVPHALTLRVMELMDEIRRQGGATFPQNGA